MSDSDKSSLPADIEMGERQPNQHYNPPHGVEDVFGDEADHQIHYKTLSWQFVAILMIAEIVSNGMLSLPAALAVVGLVPGIVLIMFFGLFGLFTAKILIDFKLNHPEVHNMGDAGMLLFGPVGRELLGAGTIIFAVAATGSEILSGQQALSTLSGNGLCAIYFLLMFSAAAFFVAIPRTLDKLCSLGLLSAAFIMLSGLVALVGAGIHPSSQRVIQLTVPQNFYQSFLAITNPVFSYAGHFMFFILISEMRRPEDAMKAAWCLQGFATTFYTVFSVVMYVFIGSTVQSPAFFSLPEKWSKAAFAIASPNFLLAAGLYAHTASKLTFVRIFRRSRHLHSHTRRGWVVWIGLCATTITVAFIFTVSVPIFSDLIGISAALFASWYTYGIAGFFWIHDAMRKGEAKNLQQKWFATCISLMTIVAGLFICVAGTYVTIKLISDAYKSGTVGKPFTC